MITLSYRDFRLSAGNTQILDGIDLDLVGPGVIALLGPSGVGKSSLLRATQRLIEHGRDGWSRSGEVLFNGQTVFGSGFSKQQLARRIGFIHQKPRMLAGSVLANVEFALKHVTTLKRNAIRRLAEEALEQVGLTWELASLDLAAWKLSGGQAQRLAIARAIALQPDVLLMDEPTSALDPLKRQQVEEIIRVQARTRLIVIVTHEVHLAERLADFAAFMFRRRGGARIFEAGPAARVLRDPAEVAVQEFVRTGRAGREPGPETEPAPTAPDDLESAVAGSPFGLRLLQRVYLFVCGENTSRSPVAQAICNSEVARLLKLPPGGGQPKFEALSAGLSVSASRPISAKAIHALSELGCTLQPHASRPITQELVDRADAIYCMTDEQCRAVALRFPAATWKLQRLDPLGNVEDSGSPDSGDFLRIATRIRDLVRWRLESQFRFPLAE
ncbi:MAG: phosphate transport system ATP-binding protein [Verrucomicrobiota bacterium]